MILIPACWSEYFSAAQTFSYLYRHAIHVSDPAWNFPSTIEGLPTGIIDHLMLLPAGNFSVHAYLQRFNLEPFPAWPPLLVFAGAFAFWLWLSRGAPAARLLPGMAAWLSIGDLFLPVQRESYNDVLILDVVAAGLAVSPGIPWGLWPCLLALPIGAVVSIFNLDRPWRINLPTMLFTLGAVMFLFMHTTCAEKSVRETADG